MSEKYQWFNGLKFTRDEKTGYYLNSTIKERIHRYVWKHYNGEIPKGYHVHHKDRVKSNNNISNLQLKTHSKHISMHGNEINAVHHEDLVRRMENARRSASIWHGSSEGKEWHKKHYEKIKDALHVKAEYVCELCGNAFTTAKKENNRFCSSKCKSAWRRKEGLDNEQRICKKCGKEFITSKFKSTACCSKSCSNSLYPRRRKLSE